MKAVKITGILREEVGTKSAKQLRHEGMVPCVIYGKEKDNVHFYTHKNNFNHLLYTAEAHLVEIEIDGKAYRTVIRDAQYHPVSDEILHVDFYEFTKGEPITMLIPIRLIGNAKGVRNGGRLKVNMRKLPIKAGEENMPGLLELNIENLKIGGVLRASDIASENFEIMEEAHRTIVMVQTARAAIVEEEDEDEDEEGEGEGEGEESSEEEAAEASKD